MGHNGDGVGGSYYDWSTGEYRSSGPGHEVVGFNYIQSVIAPYTIAVSAIIYTGTRSNPYETLQAASLRTVYDLSDLENSVFIYQTGQSGWVQSNLYRNMNPLWAKNEYLPLKMKPERVTRQLTLNTK